MSTKRIADMWKIGSLLANLTPPSTKTASNKDKIDNSKQVINKEDNNDHTNNISLTEDSKKQVLFKDFLSYYNENTDAIDNYNSSLINNNDNSIDYIDNTTRDINILDLFHNIPSPLECIDTSVLDRSLSSTTSSAANVKSVIVDDNNFITKSTITESTDDNMITLSSLQKDIEKNQIVKSLNNNCINTSIVKAIAADAMVLFRDSQLIALIQGIISHWNKFNNQIKLNSNINYKKLELKLFSLYISKIFHGLPTRLLIASTWRSHGSAYWNRYRNIDFCNLEESIYLLLSDT